MIDLFNAVKDIVRTHDGLRYQPIFISSPSWEEAGPLFATQEEAQKWLDGKIAWSGRKGDWGYVAPLQPAEIKGGDAKEVVARSEQP